jgi:phosphoglycolate phosphatase
MPSLPFDVVVFDLDGTLADTAPDLAAALNHVLSRLGRPPIEAEAVRNMIGHGARALLRKGLAATGDASEELVERGFATFLDFYAANICRGSRAYEGVEASLDALREAGARLAVCTNKPEHLTHLLLDALGWQDRFDSIVGGDTLPVRKPDPAALREAVAGAGGGSAVLVGDSITDANTARAAGVPFIAVSFGFSDRPAEALGADAIIDGFDELIPALKGLISAP